MGCNCKHCQQEIQEGKMLLAFFRKLFISRMTVDSDHNDRRRKDFNQAIFSWWYDDETKLPENATQCWTPMTLDMVLQCFDDAVYDWRKSWCDDENCKRK